MNDYLCKPLRQAEFQAPLERWQITVQEGLTARNGQYPLTEIPLEYSGTRKRTIEYVKP
jgi:hypothetical protein